MQVQQRTVYVEQDGVDVIPTQHDDGLKVVPDRNSTLRCGAQSELIVPSSVQGSPVVGQRGETARLRKSARPAMSAGSLGVPTHARSGKGGLGPVPQCTAAGVVELQAMNMANQ
ncbi:MAG: hypothetical protein ACI9DC_001524 [Gammaproteobacteria bacterium]|jgi:hypothetical protein